MPSRRILVVKLSSLGDTLHALPAVAELARQLDACVEWAVQPAFAPIVSTFSCVSKIHVVPRPSQFREFLSARKKIHSAEPFDLVVDFQGLLKSALVARAARRVKSGSDGFSGKLIGPSFSREGASFFYDEVAGVRNKNRHAIDECFDILRHLGLVVPAEPSFPMAPPAINLDSLAPELSGLTGPSVAVAPFSRWKTKNWPESHFSEAISILYRTANARIFVVGGSGDREGAERIVASASVPAANLCGKLSLPESAGLLQHCDALLTNDSGPMHIAAALGVPCVAPFGPTSAERTGPYGSIHTVLRAPAGVCSKAPCRCSRCPLGEMPPRCMAEISAQSTAKAVVAAIAKRRPLKSG